MFPPSMLAAFMTRRRPLFQHGRRSKTAATVYDPLVKYDVVIIGAGAAGLMCAIEAGKRGRSVLVLERNETVGKKIRISGGGRCNFTNLHTTADHFISANANFHKSALARYTPEDFIRMVRRHRIAYHEKKLGQLFCDGTSQQIINMLLNECDAAGVPIQTNCSVCGIEKGERPSRSTLIRCPAALCTSGENSMDHNHSSRGPSCRPEPRATQKRKSPPAEWTPRPCPRRRWRPAMCRASTSSEKLST